MWPSHLMPVVKFRIEKLDCHLHKWQKNLSQTQSLRLGLGLALFTFSGLLPWTESPQILFVFWLSSFFAFIFFVLRSRRQRTFIDKLSARKLFFSRVLARQKGHSPQTKCGNLDRLPIDLQGVAKDLHLVGPSSVLAMINECVTDGGEQLLVKQLTEPTLEKSIIEGRQQLIQKLTRLAPFLSRLNTINLKKNQPLAAQFLKKSLMQPILLKGFFIFAVGHGLLYPLTWTLVVLSLLGTIQWQPTLPLVAYIVFSFWSRGKISNVFSRAQDFGEHLRHLSPTFDFIESRMHHPSLKPLVSNIQKAKISHRLKSLDRINAALSVQGHPLAYIGFNLILPWDYIFSYRLERWRKTFAQDLDLLMDELFALEASISLSVFAHYQPVVFPKISASKPALFETQGLFHPLIPRDQVVPNDFSIPNDKRLILITGSNMSGKSTFMRTVGLNQKLAMMGAPVFAKSMTTFVGDVKTCLQVTDNLEAGYSTFYYEVKTIADLLKQAENGATFIYLIDEIFRGTNNRERLIGSEAVLKRLISAQNAIGFVSTHDLELAHLADTHSPISNWHFRDDVESGELKFSYKVHPGPCPTTNALKIMAKAGLPVHLPS